MPLGVLLVLVVGGIAGLAGLLHALGFSRTFDLQDADVARAEWNRHWPDDAVRAIYLAPQAALVLTDQGPGLLRVFGADTVAHRIRAVTDAPQGLHIGFRSFAVPDVVVGLGTVQRQEWELALKGQR